MDPGVAIAVGVLWFLFNVFGRKKKPGETRARQPGSGNLPARPGGRLQELRREPTSPAVVDFDDEAEGIAARRIASVRGRERPLGESDHAKFDERIRREAADATATPTPNLAQLRHAVVWREILGPPVAMRDPDDR